MSLEEVRNFVGYNFSAQNRAVTINDYETLIRKMPAQFGAPAKVAIVEEDNKIKINVFVGPSRLNTKKINLFYFPDDISYTIKLVNNSYSDRFDYKITNNFLYVTRIDENIGWDYPHSVDICINSNETIYLFKESMNGCLENANVTHNNIKILDSRDIDYYNGHGW